MNTKIAVAVLLGLVIGVAGMALLDRNEMPSPSTHMMSDGTMMGNTSQSMSGAMNGMMMGLSGKTGDEFDKAFLSEMIVHHEGAVEMAEAALKNAGHVEIKKMAEAIISAQTAEIKQMKEWQNSWYNAQ